MVERFEHPSRVARWRDGAFEVLPEASTATQTVWFPFPLGDEEGSDDQGWEGLLTQPAGPDQSIVLAIPAFVDDVNLGDRVEVARQAEGTLVATRRISDSGRFPFRVFFPEPTGSAEDTRWQGLMREFEPHGCWFDVYSPRLVTLSVDVEVFGPVVGQLEDGRQEGRWNMEAGRTRLPQGLVPDPDGRIPWIG